MLSIRNNLPVPPRARARMWPELAGERMKTHPASILAAAILSFGATPATGEPLNEINDRTTLSQVCAQTFASLASFAACSCAKL